MTGVAYELRESSYTAANTSMLATAYGRTKEYKDRYAVLCCAVLRCAVRSVTLLVVRRCGVRCCKFAPPRGH
jgi:hypothetical protein